ncbi:cyanoexosortase A [Rubidibacter lacunae]|nr:cyanoexosortase A [Rubidibacter lacunae]
MEQSNFARRPDVALALGIAISILVAHASALWWGGAGDLLGTSLLLWLAIASLLWDKRETFAVESGIVSSAIGLGLVGLVTVRNFSPEGFHLRISPLLAFLGLGLLTVGARHLHRYWKELLILGMLALGPLYELTLNIINLPNLTATFSSFALWYAGFDVAREGLNIYLPGGMVEVYGACSGVGSIMQMTNLAVLFLLLFPTNWAQKIACVVVGIALGFAVNAGRIGWLAVLAAKGDRAAFDYWHGGNGSLVFFAFNVLLFWGFVWLTVLREPQEVPQLQVDEDLPRGELDERDI